MSEQGVIRVRPTEQSQAKLGLAGFMGVSAATAGTQGLSMKLVVIPPGGSAPAHRHVGFETAIYMLEGRVETLYGEGLTESIVTEPGDFLFIPAHVPHQPRNISDQETARAVVCRNDAAEDEHVVPYEAPRA